MNRAFLQIFEGSQERAKGAFMSVTSHEGTYNYNLYTFFLLVPSEAV
jgi:hypothetical protein